MLLPKIRVDIAVKDEDAEQVVEAITKCANTGTIGDGKIWVSTLDDALRVRTGERDDAARGVTRSASGHRFASPAT